MISTFCFTFWTSFVHKIRPPYHHSTTSKTLQLPYLFVGVILADVGLDPFYLRATTMDFNTGGPLDYY
jgi:hypothetical protein